MKKEEKIIMYDSDEAAKLVKNISGWVSSDGRFYGKDEHLARYAGSTHSKCECGNIMSRGWSICDDCRRKKRIERYNLLEFKEWNGKDYLCLYDTDQYFWDSDDIENYLEENDLKLEDLRLVICRPNYFREIDYGHWIDDLPEDMDLPKEFEAKIKELNKYIDSLKPSSYMPSDIRTEYKRS